MAQGPVMSLHRFVAAALACLAAAAFAQTPSNRDIYMYQGADRDKRLVGGAKKERQVVLYSTMPVADSTSFCAALQRKYGEQHFHLRTASENIEQRAVSHD